MNIGKAIKACRIARGMTQGELVTKTGGYAAHLSVSYLSLLERGKRNPPLALVQKLATALEIPLPLLVFLGMDAAELDAAFPRDLAEKLSATVLDLLK